jgi:lipopolysaccharide biosynthesis glycosyltransferase
MTIGSDRLLVPIVFGFDESFVVPAGVCITSLLSNALETTSYEIHVISKDLGRTSKETFVRMVEGYDGHHGILFHDPGEAYAGDQATSHFTTAMYYRFLIPRLLQQHEKAIYSDVDVVFLEDLAHLMKIDLGDRYLAAVTARYVVHLMENSLRKSGIQHLRDRYFASGLLILNLREIEKGNLVGRLDRLIRDHRYEFPDNDALNVACQDKVAYLPLRYCVPPFVESLLELETNRSDADRRRMLVESIERPAIIHYLGPDKPWNGHVRTTYERYWWEYYRKSVWYSSWFFIKNGLYKKTRCQVRSARRNLKKKLGMAVTRLTRIDREDSTL